MGIPSQRYLKVDQAPYGYTQKTQGTLEFSDLVWSTSEGKFLKVGVVFPDLIGEDVSEFWFIAQLDNNMEHKHWITFDVETEVVWGWGETSEDSMKAAKFKSYDDTHGGFGYEFSCWCQDLKTFPCTPDLYNQIQNRGRLSVSSDQIQSGVIT